MRFKAVGAGKTNIGLIYTNASTAGDLALVGCNDTVDGNQVKGGVGYCLVEAPRGPLIHRYVVENGVISDAQFIIPTVHNMHAIERALMVAGNRYIHPEGINLELEKAVGRVVRAFDPCIACATQ